VKVVHVNADDVAGGAARAAHRLHEGLRRQGHDSCLFVSRKRSHDPTVVVLRPSVRFTARLRRRLAGRWIDGRLAHYTSSCPPGYERFHGERTAFGAELVAQLPSADVVNLHWIAGFVDYRAFFGRVPQHTPVVWTLHDMNPFTGGCHYDLGCGRYAEGCGSCPQLGSSRQEDLSHQVFQRKRRIFERIDAGRLHLVALNDWMAAEVKRSVLLRRFPVTVIPNSLDTEVFAPRERALARDVLGLPRDARVVLFVATSIHNRRKGFALLTRALAGLQDTDDLCLLSLGAGQPGADPGIPHVHLGVVENERLLSLVYSAADLFVIPSLQDNLPNTVLEALACGVPVVGFEVGGIPDMIQHGVTGLLVPAADAEAMGRAVRHLLEDESSRAEMADRGRRVAADEYALEVQALRYARLYEAVCGASRA
jgi:glycosyltransferase involved in cell wall biosynthesis